MPGVAFNSSVCDGACGAPPSVAAAWSPNVFANSKNVVRQGDAFTVHSIPPPHGRNVSSGSSTVYVNGKQAARIGDPLSCGANIATGSSNVIVGG